jgi:hypothetical protein
LVEKLAQPAHRGALYLLRTLQGNPRGDYRCPSSGEKRK